MTVPGAHRQYIHGDHPPSNAGSSAYWARATRRNASVASDSTSAMRSGSS